MYIGKNIVLGSPDLLVYSDELKELPSRISLSAIAGNSMSPIELRKETCYNLKNYDIDDLTVDSN